MKTFDKEKLNKFAKSDPSNWIGKAKWRRANKAWLDKSAKIALKILRHIRKEGIKQHQLAEMLGVTPQNISKILKGNENLKLETITKFETVLGLSLIEVRNYQFTTIFKSNALFVVPVISNSPQFQSSVPYPKLLEFDSHQNEKYNYGKVG